MSANTNKYEVLDSSLSRWPSKRAQINGEAVNSRNFIRSADRPEIEFKVACDVTKSVNFAKFDGFHDVTAILNSISGRLVDCIKMRLWTSLRHFFYLFLIAISIKIGQVPYSFHVSWSWLFIGIVLVKKLQRRGHLLFPWWGKYRQFFSFFFGGARWGVNSVGNLFVS